MAAELDVIRTGEHAGKARMVFGNELPWHRDGIKLTPEQQTDFEHVLTTIDVPLEKRPYCYPVATPDGEPQRYNTSKDSFYIMRPDTKKILGSVGSGYEPVSNRTAFEVFRPLIDNGQALIETAGVLRDGADAWMLTRWNMDKLGSVAQEVFGAEILPYSAVMVNHTGRRAMLLGNTGIRIVCCNTLAMAEHESSSGDTAHRWISVDHRPGAGTKLVEAAESLFGRMIVRFETLAKQYQILKHTRLTGEQFDRMVTQVVTPDPRLDPSFNPSAKLAPLVVERFERKKKEVERLWYAGKGHVGDASAWEAMNAAVELLDHNRELYPSRAGTYRTASLLTGTLAEMKNRVTDLLVSHSFATAA